MLKVMDGRRHSVDIPISRTLVALRRVRSLRDPSTNSLSKFSPLMDNWKWETNSNTGITLGFENKYEEGTAVGNDVVETRSDRFGLLKEKYCNEQELCYNSKKSNYSHEIPGCIGNLASATIRNIHVEGSNLDQPGEDMLCGSKSKSERYCRDKGLQLAYITPSSDYQEGEGSCNEPNDGSAQEQKINHNASNRACYYRKHARPSNAAAGDVLSQIGSPCLSRSDVMLGGTSQDTSLCGNEDADILDSGQCGCGISRCWSRTPRLRESSLGLDVEEQPLLAGNGSEALLSGKRSSWNHTNNEVTLYSESPRSLSQKFRPKSFDELMGQNVVSRSLLKAISIGMITSFYLFHGPRGTGKTSASRIFAAALNCLSPEIDKPCGLCQECVSFFSGRSRDVKVIDALKVNKTQRFRAIIKSAENSPFSSRFKVFIVDECHLLQEDTWATFLNNLDGLSRHVLFIMITPDLHKLPRSAVSRSQRYHFPKIKEVDITCRLEKICVAEGFDFDQEALEFIAAKSSGSLRDAEMVLEQLSLIGKKITMSLVYELMGVVSDDELLDLLNLALSSNTPETVKRARELMSSRIDPLQLISQMANLIMDILTGTCPDTSEVKRRLHRKYTSEADMQQLSHALKILSETEKQLRMSKNQTTWLTVALLQLSSVGSSLDLNESRLCMRTSYPKDGDFCSTSSTSESLKHLIACSCDCNESCKMTVQNRQQTLESIWRRAAGMCEPSSLKNFLYKHGNLVSVSLKQGVAVAELGFHRPKYVSKAEKSWKAIASALQHVLGHNIEIRIHLIVSTSSKDKAKWKKPSFSLLGCSRLICYGSKSSPESVSEPSDNSDFISGKASTRDKHVESCSSKCGSHVSHTCCNGKEVIRAIRNKDGNALNISMTTPLRFTDEMSKAHQSGGDHLKDGRNSGCQDLTALEPEKRPGCFPRTVKLRKSNASETIFLEKNEYNSVALSVPCTKSSEIYFHASDPVIVSCSRSEVSRNCCRNDPV